MTRIDYRRRMARIDSGEAPLTEFDRRVAQAVADGAHCIRDVMKVLDARLDRTYMATRRLRAHSVLICPPGIYMQASLWINPGVVVHNYEILMMMEVPHDEVL